MPARVDFGTVKPSQTVTRGVSLTNVGTASVNIDSVSINPVGPVNISTGSFTLDPSKTVQLQLTFAPTTNSSYSGILTILTSVDSSSYSPKGKGGRRLPRITQHINLPVSGRGDEGSTTESATTVTMSPGSGTLRSAQSLQFVAKVTGTTNTAVSWTAALGTISSSGLYTAPTVTSQTIDTVSAISAADPTKFAEASVLVQSGNSGQEYSIANPPPPGWYPYDSATSLMNKPLPGNVLQHCFGNTSECSAGDAIAKYAMTDNGICYNGGNTDMSCGQFVIPQAGTSGGNNANSDQGVPLYYCKSDGSDCVWWNVSNSCTGTNPRMSLNFLCPAGANIGGGSGGDQFIACLDQKQNLLVEIYAYGAGTGATIGGTNTCSGTGSSSCAVSAKSVSYCSASRLTDNDWNVGSYTSGSYVLGNSVLSNGSTAFAATIRFNELTSGTINHALQLTIDCVNPDTSAYSFPAHAGGANALMPCSSSNSNEGRPGDLYFLDYTPTQIANFGLSAWKTAMLTAMSNYGLYVGATFGNGTACATEGACFGSGVPGTGGIESQTAYQWYGVDPTSPDYFLVQLCAQGGWSSCTYGSFTSSASAYLFQDIPLATGPGGTDISGRSCSSGSGCDWTGHIHMADQCVAKALAGEAGACP